MKSMPKPSTPQVANRANIFKNILINNLLCTPSLMNEKLTTHPLLTKDQYSKQIEPESIESIFNTHYKTEKQGNERLENIEYFLFHCRLFFKSIESHNKDIVSRAETLEYDFLFPLQARKDVLTIADIKDLESGCQDLIERLGLYMAEVDTGTLMVNHYPSLNDGGNSVGLDHLRHIQIFCRDIREKANRHPYEQNNPSRNQPRNLVLQNLYHVAKPILDKIEADNFEPFELLAQDDELIGIEQQYLLLWKAHELFKRIDFKSGNFALKTAKSDKVVNATQKTADVKLPENLSKDEYIKLVNTLVEKMHFQKYIDQLESKNKYFSDKAVLGNEENRYNKAKKVCTTLLETLKKEKSALLDGSPIDANTNFSNFKNNCLKAIDIARKPLADHRGIGRIFECLDRMLGKIRSFFTRNQATDIHFFRPRTSSVKTLDTLKETIQNRNVGVK